MLIYWMVYDGILKPDGLKRDEKGWKGMKRDEKRTSMENDCQFGSLRDPQRNSVIYVGPVLQELQSQFFYSPA